MTYPIVFLSCIDHCAFLEGEPEPINVVSVGLLEKEDTQGYYLRHMVFDRAMDHSHNTGAFVAKVPGLCLRVLGHFTFEG